MRVKICGITNAEDAFMCEDMGADAIGFVHVDGRQRSVPVDDVREICASVGPMTATVLVCSPADAESAVELASRSGSDAVQLYGLDVDSLDAVRACGVGVIRAVPPNREQARKYADHADALLFESGTPGTGTGFDYALAPVDCCRRAIIAGGLNVSNIDAAKRRRPYALDVSSGVESTPGRKDPDLVREFIRRCRL
jgi:phosphoribosylanthranilate isomerase